VVNEEKFIAALRANMVDRDAAADKLAGIVPQVNGKLLKRLTDEGYLNAYIVEVDGRGHYAIWLNFTLDGGCYLNYAVQLLPRAEGLDILANAVEEIARYHRSTYVRFNTSRLGLLKRGRALGYLPQGVTLEKRL